MTEVNAIFGYLSKLRVGDYRKSKTCTSEDESKLEQLIAIYLKASVEQRRFISSLVEPSFSFIFLLYAKERAIRVMNTRLEEDLRKGLISLIIENRVFDWRDTLSPLALLYHSGIKAGLDSHKLVYEASSLAQEKMSRLLKGFADRPLEARSIAAFGYKETTSEQGFGFAAISSETETKMSAPFQSCLGAKQPIAVACAGNAAYALPMTVMLTSVVCNLKSGRDVDIYIVESGIPPELQQKMETSIRQNKQGDYRLDIHWKKLDQSLLQNLPGAGHVHHVTMDTYSRLLLPDLLPADCPRVVYLDCDLVVLKDIAVLYDALDDRHTVAAVANVFLPYVSSHFFFTTNTVVFNHVELGIPATNRYFQSGVMVINLPLWKERNITTRVIEYLETHKDKIYFHDQGALNAILWDQWLRLDQRWNQTTTVLTPRHWKSPAYTPAERRKTRDDPFIVHFTGRDKPWHPGFRRPRSSFFNRYFQKTLFKDELKISPVESIIGFKSYYFLWKAKDTLRLLFSRLKSGQEAAPSGE